MDLTKMHCFETFEKYAHNGSNEKFAFPPIKKHFAYSILLVVVAENFDLTTALFTAKVTKRLLNFHLRGYVELYQQELEVLFNFLIS